MLSRDVYRETFISRRILALWIYFHDIICSVYAIKELERLVLMRKYLMLNKNFFYSDKRNLS